MEHKYQNLINSIKSNKRAELYQCNNQSCNNIELYCFCSSKCYRWNREDQLKLEWYSCFDCYDDIEYCENCKDEFLTERNDVHYCQKCIIDFMNT